MDDIHEHLHKVPFRPVGTVLTNNDVQEIRHRDFAVATRAMLQIAFPSGEGEEADSHSHIGIALIHIINYELLPPALLAVTAQSS